MVGAASAVAGLFKANSFAKAAFVATFTATSTAAEVPFIRGLAAITFKAISFGSLLTTLINCSCYIVIDLCAIVSVCCHGTYL